MAPAIGQPAPAFELLDQSRTRVTLESLGGRSTVLVFMPFPFTGTCEGEMCDLRDRLGQFSALDAQVVVVTCDTMPANRVWAEQNNFDFPILSDFWPHGATSTDYGVFNEALGCANRTTFVIDAEGTVRDIIASESLGEVREVDHYLSALNALSAI